MDAQQERRRITWTPRLAAGVGLAGACLLLWPFAGWSWIPIAVGVGLLILLRLLRLDGLLRGWAPHLAGLVVLVLLVLDTGPWEWALAVGIAVLLAGLTQLPRWQLLAAGAALTAAATAGLVLTQQQAKVEQAAAQARENAISASSLQREPKDVVPTAMYLVAYDDAGTACALFSDEAERQFAQAAGAPDCSTAVHLLAAQVTDRRRYAEVTLPPSAVQVRDAVGTVNGCAVTWAGAGTPPGPKLGLFNLQRVEGPGRGYLVTGYSPCP